MSIAKDFASSIKDVTKEKTSSYDTQAMVTRIEGKTAWVHIPGGVNETPVQLTVNAAEGDAVQVRVANGKAWITGNASAPPTDDKRANVAYVTATSARDEALTAHTAAQNAVIDANAARVSAEQAIADAATAQTAAGQAQTAASAAQTAASSAQTQASAAATAASNAQTSADNAQNALKSVVSGAQTVEKAVSVMQTALEAVVDYDPTTDTTQEYFWHDANGAHVLGDTSGYRNDITSTGMKIVNANTETVLASFGTETSIKTTNGTELAHFGYDEGQAESGTAIAPYYLLGLQHTTEDTYSADSTYIVGDLRVYNGQLYVCMNDITSPEPWTPSNWALVVGNYSITEGYKTVSNGTGSHAEGRFTRALGHGSHAEGDGFFIKVPGQPIMRGYTVASGKGSHAEGYLAMASGKYSHAEGASTKASGDYSHVEGNGTVASGISSHAEGASTRASGNQSHSQNLSTIASQSAQTAIGKYNIEDTATSTADQKAFIIGNGTSDTARSNALTVDWSGNVDIASGAEYRVNGTNILEEVKTLILTTSSISSLPQTVTDSRISADHVVVNSVLSNPSAQTGDWTVTTSDGSLSIAGSISGSTTVTLYLCKSM